MNDYKELIDSLRICVKYNKAADSLCNAEFAADAIERLTYERHLIQQSIERYDNNWLMDGDDIVLKIREILEGKQ